MLKMLRKQKAQGTLEYAVLIMIVIGALLTMQAYLKRGIQGRLRQASDDVGDQYSVGNTSVNKRVTFVGATRESFRAGAYNSVITQDEETGVSSNQALIDMEQEYWGGI